jgi:hypothetical protein
MSIEKKQDFNINQFLPPEKKLKDFDIEHLWNEIKDKIDYSLFKYDNEIKPEMTKVLWQNLSLMMNYSTNLSQRKL